MQPGFWLALARPLTPDNRAPFPFGFRTSFGFRVSAFGFEPQPDARMNSRAPRTIPVTPSPIPAQRRAGGRAWRAWAAWLGVVAGRSTAKGTVWQIDPQKCVRCGNCATHCVLEQSAVKCVHAYAICGYCQLCTGFFRARARTT